MNRLPHWVGFGVLFLLGCQKEEPVARAPLLHLSAREEILQVSAVWAAEISDRRLLDAPSPLAAVITESTLRLDLSDPKAAHQDLLVKKRLEYRDGSRINCEATPHFTAQVRFGRRRGEPALELRRPVSPVSWRCDAPLPAELDPTVGAEAARFVLRQDQLVAVEPASDRRRFLPSE